MSYGESGSFRGDRRGDRDNFDSRESGRFGEHHDDDHRGGGRGRSFRDTARDLSRMSRGNRGFDNSNGRFGDRGRPETDRSGRFGDHDRDDDHRNRGRSFRESARNVGRMSRSARGFNDNDDDDRRGLSRPARQGFGNDEFSKSASNIRRDQSGRFGSHAREESPPRRQAMERQLSTPSVNRRQGELKNIADLCEEPSIEVYQRYIEREIDSLDELLKLDEHSWGGLLDHVSQKSRKDRINMTYVHKELIKTRLRAERSRRQRMMSRQRGGYGDDDHFRDPNDDFYNDRPEYGRGGNHIDVRGRERDHTIDTTRLPSAHGAYCLEGFNCQPKREAHHSDEDHANRTGMFCLAICIISLTVSLILHYMNKSGFSDGGEQQDGSDESNGSWDFIEFLAVTGWIIASISFLAFLYAVNGDANSREQGGNFGCPDCVNEPLCQSDGAEQGLCPSCESNDDGQGLCPELQGCCDGLTSDQGNQGRRGARGGPNNNMGGGGRDAELGQGRQEF